MNIWRESVKAAHHFLKAEDCLEIETFLSDFLPNTDLSLVIDARDKAIGFMLLGRRHIEAFFINLYFLSKVLGTSSSSRYGGIASVDANQQNKEALNFYKHLGFILTS